MKSLCHNGSSQATLGRASTAIVTLPCTGSILGWCACHTQLAHSHSPGPLLAKDQMHLETLTHRQLGVGSPHWPVALGTVPLLWFTGLCISPDCIGGSSVLPHDMSQDIHHGRPRLTVSCLFAGPFHRMFTTVPLVGPPSWQPLVEKAQLAATDGPMQEQCRGRHRGAHTTRPGPGMALFPTLLSVDRHPAEARGGEGIDSTHTLLSNCILCLCPHNN